MENANQPDVVPRDDALPRLILAVEDEPQVMRFLRSTCRLMAAGWWRRRRVSGGWRRLRAACRT